MQSLKKQHGAFPFLAVLSGLSLSTWAIIGLTLLLGIQTARLHLAENAAEKWENTHKTFVVGTELAGKARVARNKDIELQRAAITQEVENHGREMYEDLDKDYKRVVADLDAERMRNSKGTSGNRSTSLASTAGALVCPDGQADFADRVRAIEAEFERFDRSNIERHHRGDQAIVRTIVCDEWLDKQEKVNQK